MLNFPFNFTISLQPSLDIENSFLVDSFLSLSFGFMTGDDDKAQKSNYLVLFAGLRRNVMD